MKTTYRLLALAVLVSGACSFDITNPNTPPLLGANPTREQVQEAVSGLLLGARADYADWALEAGIVGREAYRFDASDPRWIDELLTGPLDPGNIRFGGDHWFEQYRNIRTGHNILKVIGTATALTAQEQDAVRGFVKTIQALDFIGVLDAHSQDSIPIAVSGDPVKDPPAPFETNTVAWAYVSALLDTAENLLRTGGSAFPVQLTSGFGGFSTPATFAQFNRALKSRVEVYRGSMLLFGCGVDGTTCFGRALTILEDPDSSFLSTTAPLSRGVYHVYGTGSGDLANPLFQDTATSIQLVHPSIFTDAESSSAIPRQIDRRFATKVAQTAPPRSGGDPPLASDLVWIRYLSPIDPVPIIRNEELILLRAEARLGTGNLSGALDDVNVVRQTSGGLDPIALATWTALTPDEQLNRVLKERRYSLLFEGGHRWIDARRTNRLAQIPIDRPPDPAANFPGDVVHKTWPIPTDEVLARKPLP